MQKIVFERDFSVLFDTDKTKNVQNFEGKIQPIKKIIIQKIQKKSLKIWLLRNSDRLSKKSLRGALTSYLWYLHKKFRINRTSHLGVCLYTCWFTDKLLVLLLLEIILHYSVYAYSAAGSEDTWCSFVLFKNCLQKIFM